MVPIPSLRGSASGPSASVGASAELFTEAIRRRQAPAIVLAPNHPSSGPTFGG
jgi:hypothetical protein